MSGLLFDLTVDCLQKPCLKYRTIKQLSHVHQTATNVLSFAYLLQQLNTDIFTLRTVMTANIIGLPYGQDGSQIPVVKTEVVVNVTKIKKELNVLKATPWWIPFVSAVVAVLVAAAIAGVLHRVRIFFKKKKKSK